MNDIWEWLKKNKVRTFHVELSMSGFDTLLVYTDVTGTFVVNNFGEISVARMEEEKKNHDASGDGVS